MTNNEKSRAKDQQLNDLNNPQGRSQNLFKDNKNFVNNYTDADKQATYDIYTKNLPQQSHTR